jgi:WD40 repeat protein
MRVQNACFSQSGNYVVAAAQDKIYAWNVSSGQLKNTITTKGASSALLTTKDEKYIIVSSENYSTIQVFNLETATLYKELKNHNTGVKKVLISKDNLYALSIGLDNSVKLWNLKDFSFVYDAIFHEKEISSADFSQHSKLFALSAIDGTISVWNMTDNKPLMKMGSGFNGIPKSDITIKKIIFGKNDSLIYSFSEIFDNDITIWNHELGKRVGKLKGHNHNLTDIVSYETDSSSYLLSTSNDNRTILWDLNTKNPVGEFKGQTKEISKIISARSGNSFVSIDMDNNARIWNLKTGRQIYNLPDSTVNVVYTPTDDYFVALYNDFSFQSWNANECKVASERSTNTVTDVRADRFCFNSEGRKLYVNYSNFIQSYSFPNLTEEKIYKFDNIKDLKISSIFMALIENDSNLVIWNLEEDKEHKRFKGFHFKSLEFIPYEDKLTFVANSDSIFIYDIINDKSILVAKNKAGDLIKIEKTRLTDNGNFLTAEKTDGTMKIYNLSTLKEIFTIEERSPLTLLTDSMIISTSYLDHKIKLRYLNSGKIFKELDAHHNDIIALSVFQQKYLLSSDKDHKTIVWNLKDAAKEVYNIYSLENNNWLTKMNNTMYYQCSKDASKKVHYVTPDYNIISFEQLDPIFNRPDMVIYNISKNLNQTDTAIVTQYYNLWLKRMDKLGLKSDFEKNTEIAVPEAKIVSWNSINGMMDLKVHVQDLKHSLRNFNIWINEVPYFGSRGYSLSHLNSNSWDTIFTAIPLSFGENKIQISVQNDLGFENFKYAEYLYHEDNTITSQVHFIGIGVDNFLKSTKSLNYCVKDINDIDTLLRRKYKVKKENVKILTNEQVTRENVLNLKNYLKNVSVHDKVFISCSSHGLLDKSLNFYLAMHDTDFNNPANGGLSFAELESLLDDIPSRKKLLLLDACNSGENDSSEIAFVKPNFEQLEFVSRHQTGVTCTPTIFKQMKEHFVNVRNNTGSYIISATEGFQSAHEGDKILVNNKLDTIRNGSFSYAILEYLKNHANSDSHVSELKKYVEKRVVEITKGTQTPTSRQETIEADWKLFGK